MIRNIIHNTQPNIFHAQGKPFYCPLWNRIKSISGGEKVIPSNLDIITFNNGDSHPNKSPGSFEWSIQNKCHVLGSDIVDWVNVLKIGLTIKFLESSNKEYVLACDSCDVVVYSFENIIDKFLDKKCDMLYNAEFKPYPHDLEHESSIFERSVFKPPFQHLNSGVWIGKREFALQFYRELSKHIDNTCDQKIIREWYFKYPSILIDDTCDIFQTLNSVTLDILR